MTGPVLHDRLPPSRPMTMPEVREMRRLRLAGLTIEAIAFETARNPQTVRAYVSHPSSGRSS